MRTNSPDGRKIVRFPMRQPDEKVLSVFHGLAPDPRHVMYVAEAYRIELPPADLSDLADARTAEEILDRIPMEDGPTRQAGLIEMRDAFVRSAVQSAMAAHAAEKVAERVHQRNAEAAARGTETPAMREEAEHLSTAAARALIVTYIKYQETRGALRALRLASEGGLWFRQVPNEDMLWLIGQQEIENNSAIKGGR